MDFPRPEPPPKAIVSTDRLTLRNWLPADRDTYAAMNADPRVRAHFLTLLARRESDAEVDRFTSDIARQGWGLWALEKRSDRRFIGFTGLQAIGFESPVQADLEIGWRLSPMAWHQGLATEAARAALDFAWRWLDVPRIVSIAVPGNLRSIAVMERIGMSRRADLDFEHPNIAPGHPLRPHIVHVIERP